uniref:DRMBL domain-containing protein n=1 Tax=Macrostomum lignano TaxID=282301 RepID=A0A1I8FGT3_9PLAT
CCLSLDAPALLYRSPALCTLLKSRSDQRCCPKSGDKPIGRSVEAKGDYKKIVRRAEPGNSREQLVEFEAFLAKMKSGDVSLVDQVDPIFFAQKQPGALRTRLAELDRDMKVGTAWTGGRHQGPRFWPHCRSSRRESLHPSEEAFLSEHASAQMKEFVSVAGASSAVSEDELARLFAALGIDWLISEEKDVLASASMMVTSASLCCADNHYQYKIPDPRFQTLVHNAPIARETRSSETIDASKVAAAGHSLGAPTTHRGAPSSAWTHSTIGTSPAADKAALTTAVAKEAENWLGALNDFHAVPAREGQPAGRLTANFQSPQSAAVGAAAAARAALLLRLLLLQSSSRQRASRQQMTKSQKRVSSV